MVKAAIGQAQAAGRHRRVLHRKGIVGGPAMGEIETTQGTGQQVDLDAAFESRRPACRVIATAAPRVGEGVRQADAGAIVDADAGATAAKSG